MRGLDSITNLRDMNWSRLQEMVLQSMGLQRVGHNLAAEQQQHIICIFFLFMHVFFQTFRRYYYFKSIT